MKTINEIIAASSTADLTYFDTQIKHSYFDVAKAKKSDLVWSMRVIILLIENTYKKSITFYLACPDENVGSDDGDHYISIADEQSFADAYSQSTVIKDSMASYKDELPEAVSQDKALKYLSLWDELYSELISTKQPQSPNLETNSPLTGDEFYIEDITTEQLKTLILTNDNLRFKHKDCCMAFCSEGHHLYAQDVEEPDSDLFADGDFKGAITGYYNTTTYVCELLESLSSVGMDLELSDNLNTFNMPLNELKGLN